MVTQKKFQGESTIVGNKREIPASSFPKKDMGGDSRAMASHMVKPQNGSRMGFRTDTAISNARLMPERVLKPWVPESEVGTDQSLESSSSTGPLWDQFAENERLFGLKTDYNENIYTTVIDKAHPQYKERMAAAEKKAREIERSLPATTHVAEERIMDHAGIDDRGEVNDEEDKYSVVRRAEIPPYTNRENKYTPPAKRMSVAHAAQVGQTTIDPAIISSQLKGIKRHATLRSEEARTASSITLTTLPAIPKYSRPSELATAEDSDKSLPKRMLDSDTVIPVAGSSLPMSPEQQHAKEVLNRAPEKLATPMRPSQSSTRNQSSQSKEVVLNTASTIERDILDKFKSFASQQRLNAEKARFIKARADKEIKITELRKFADTFKLSTPVPTDLISIIAKDPEKQKEIQAKALQNVVEVQKAKADAAFKDQEPIAEESQTSPVNMVPATARAEPKSTIRQNASLHITPPAGATGAPDASVTSGHSGPTGSSGSGPTGSGPTGSGPTGSGPPGSGTPGSGTPGSGASGSGASGSGSSARNSTSRQSYGPFTSSTYHQHQPRSDRHSQHGPPRHSTLSQRLRNHEQQKLSNPPNHPVPVHTAPPPDMKPPNGPSAAIESPFNRRPSGMAPHLAGKLNPNSHEFRPNPSASSFNPNSYPSAGSSPRSTVNQMSDATLTSLNPPAQLLRRKTKAVDIQKCFILSHLKSVSPPQGRNWDENGGLRPSYDTLPTWRQLQDNEKSNSTMHFTYREFFERHPFSSTSLTTPNPTPSIPHMAHQHQLPFHLQHGASHGLAAQRHFPSVSNMQMHTPQNMHISHVSQFSNGDEHRMMHSNSAQSTFASPRLPFASAIPPTQTSYNQPTMQPLVAQYRTFAPHYLASHPTPVSAPMTTVTSPMMMQHQFIPGQPVGQQVSVYPLVPQYMQSTLAPQPSHIPAMANGYPSPGRPASIMMAHQSSQPGHPQYQGPHSGQPVYGLSPSMGYQQPVAYAPHNNLSVGNMRSFTVGGPQSYGTSPQHMQQYASSHRGGNGGYVKSFAHGGQIGHPSHNTPSLQHGRGVDGRHDGK